MNDIEPPAGLTADLLSEVFHIAPSDRRQNADLFEPHLAAGELRNDAAFYGLLATLATEPDPAILREYDQRMFRKRRSYKALSIRALRYLEARAGRDVGIENILAGDPPIFAAGSVEAMLRDFVLRVSADSLDEPGEPATPPDPATGDWRMLARQLEERAAELTSPDPDAAARIALLAEALVEACEEAARRERLEVVRAALAERLEALDPDLAAQLPEEADRAMLDRLEELVEAAETAAAALAGARAEEAALRRDFENAHAADDLDALALLVAKRQEAQRRTGETEAARTASLDALAAALAPAEGPAPAEAQADGAPADAAPAGDPLEATNDPLEAADESAEEPANAPDTTSHESAAPPPAADLILQPASADHAEAAQPAPGKDGDGSDTADAPATDDGEPDPQGVLPPEAACAAAAKDDDGDPAAAQGTADIAAPETAAEGAPPRPANADEPTVEPAPDNSPPPALLPVEEALARHLLAGETAFAFHLARLGAAAGTEVPIPASVLEALATAPAVQAPEDMADPHHIEVLAEMMSALPSAGAPDAAALLALAALARPALFGPHSGAREHVRNLPREGVLADLSPLVEALAGLGYQVRVSVDDLAELAGRDRRRRLPAATEALAEWLPTARHRKFSNHPPTTALLHQDLASAGEIGRVCEAAIRGEEGAEEEAEALAARLADHAGRTEFVAASERRSGRPVKDRIHGTALAWYTARLEEAHARLRAWVDAKRADARSVPSAERASLASSLGTLRKPVSHALSRLKEDGAGQGQLVDAARRLLVREIEALSRLIDGDRSPVAAAAGRANLLDDPLLRLPSGCQDWTGGLADLAEERAARDRRLMAALRTPGAALETERAAFERHVAASAVLPARALLARMRSAGLDEADARRLAQAVNDAELAARKDALSRIARLQQGLNTLAYLDVESAERHRGTIAELTRIANALDGDGEGGVALPATHDSVRTAAVPPDFPELDALLTAIEEEREALRAHIRTVQLEALRDLADDPAVGGSARAFDEAIDRLDPVMIDAALADMRSGHEVSLPTAGEKDAFDRFFPDFLSSIEGGGPPRGRVIAAARSGEAVGPVDFRELDPAERDRACQIVEVWGKAENALREGNLHKMRNALADFFGRFGLTSVKVEAERELIPRQLRRLRLRSDPWRSKRWFIPPAYGSKAGGHFPLLVATARVALDQIEAQLGDIGREQACLVLFFGRLGVKDRQELARLLRRERQHALVLDETLMLNVVARKAPPLETFLTAALPFGWLQPYHLGAGGAAPEMFFGRRDEIRRITAETADGSLIYGGRQLGKSALLDRIRQEHHRPEDGRLAHLLEIRPIGGPGRPPSDLWPEFAAVLRGERAFAGLGNTPGEIVSTLSRWLSQRPDRRIIAMFDEADNFLRAEHKNDYPNLAPLKQLMQDTQWRFKVVFAGLHNVRRLAQAPNSPLPHLGEPICVGPMNETPENRAELRRLATEPLRAAGFDYEDPALVGEVLARVNYYPSLVQVFGQRVIETMGQRAGPPGSGPRWQLGRDVLFEGEAAERIAETIRDRFQLTLRLDTRYELIAKCIALQRLDDAGGDRAVLGEGMTVDGIGRLVADWWPCALDSPSRDDLAALLSEMADLGVLGRYGGERYGLRNAQVAQMLGDRERLEREILELSDREEAVDYDAGLFHRSLAPEMPRRRAPLPDRQLEALFAAEPPGPRIVTAWTAVAGSQVAARLATAARHWQRNATIVEDRKVLRRTVEEIARPAEIVIVDLPFDAEAFAFLRADQGVARGRVLPVWLVCDGPVPPDCRAPVVRTGSWSELMLRHFLSDEGLLVYDERRLRRALMAATGGAPARVEAIQPVLVRNMTGSERQREAAIEAWQQANPLTPAQVGVDPAAEEALRLLALASESDPLRRDVLDGEAPGTVDGFLGLGLAAPVGPDHVTPTPLAKLVAGTG